MTPEIKRKRDELAEEQGIRHAHPEIKSMYPQESRGVMRSQFARLYSLGFDAAFEIIRERWNLDVMNLKAEWRAKLAEAQEKIDKSETDYNEAQTKFYNSEMAKEELETKLSAAEKELTHSRVIWDFDVNTLKSEIREAHATVKALASALEWYRHTNKPGPSGPTPFAQEALELNEAIIKKATGEV